MLGLRTELHFNNATRLLTAETCMPPNSRQAGKLSCYLLWPGKSQRVMKQQIFRLLLHKAFQLYMYQSKLHSMESVKEVWSLFALRYVSEHSHIWASELKFSGIVRPVTCYLQIRLTVGIFLSIAKSGCLISLEAYHGGPAFS